MKFLSPQREYWRLWKYNRHSQFKYYNFWRDEQPEEMWFSRFITHHFPNYKLRINFISVLGPVEMMEYHRRGINIFYTGENIHARRFKPYLDQYKMQSYNLSLGFDYEGEGNYMRLPLWVIWHFPPEATQEQIDKMCQEMSHPSLGDRPRFCVLVCSHDQSGLRKEIMDALETVGHVDSAGRYCQNTDSLHTEFDNDKPRFLQQYRYNICPENSNHKGYVTEKIFDAIKSGCVPIYNGSDNTPEPDIINQEAVLFWSSKSDNLQLISQICKLESDSNAYRHFANQARLTPQAPDIIWQYYTLLHEKLKELL